jgi:hypothetical protein
LNNAMPSALPDRSPESRRTVPAKYVIEARSARSHPYLVPEQEQTFLGPASYNRFPPKFDMKGWFVRPFGCAPTD